ncbi:hypothetical protein GQ54DRAFT_299935 [Martensiomyces pterosporus]|nr:hypothetical protein GQ54DRAFT_299935 [Martensiomyces pterosporus]
MAMAGLAYFVNAQSTQSTDAESGDIEMPYYRLSLTVYIVAAWVELCVEPLFVLSRVRVMFKMQAQCEAISVAGRCLAIIIVLFAGRYLYVSDSGANPFSLIAFAIGQMTYAVLILVTYAWRMSQELEYPVQLCYTPRPVALAEDSSAEGQGYIGGAIGSLAMTFVGQSLLKHFLTQGDNIVMSNFATPSDMGTFAVVTNYGSIPARVIFLPLEEASRAMFSKMVGKQSKTPERADRSGSDAAVEQADAELASHVLSTLGKFQFLLGSILMVFGTLYSPTLLSLLGKNDAALSQSLIAYCLYLPLMGLNGFLEAFVHSVASRSQLFQVNIAMVAFTAIYALFSIQMLSTFKLGSLGIVVANMLNMALRIGYCKRFVTQWFTKCNVRSPRFAAMLPHPAVLAMCTLSGVVVVLAQSAIGQDTLVQRLGALAVGGAMGICVLAAIWRYEREFVESILELRSGKLLKRKTE